MKNYKVLLPENRPSLTATVKADKFVIERSGTLVFYVDKSKVNGKNDWHSVRAFNSAAWVEVWLEDE